MALEQVPLRLVETNLVFTFTYGGLLNTEVTQMRLYNDTGKPRTISKVRASVGTAAVGGGITATVLKNGVNIFGSGGVTLSQGEMTDTALLNGVVWAENEYLTVSILSVGTTFAGEDLTINVTVSE